MNTQTLFLVMLIVFAAGIVLALLMVLILIYFLILGSRLAAFQRLLQNLPLLSPALRTMADGLDGAARGAELASSAAELAGQSLIAAGGVVDTLQVPTASLQTRSLWDFVKKPPSPPAVPDVFVLTSVNLVMRNTFPQGVSPVTSAGRQVSAIGQSLGPPPPQPGTVSNELHASAEALRCLAQFIESLA